MSRVTWVEHCLPGDDLVARLGLARRRDLAVEVANRPGLDEAALRRSGVSVTTVQA
jgi:hypothetical protein